MERDPLRLAWRTSPGRHLLGFLLLGLSAVALVFGLELIRVTTDVALRADDVAMEAATFLRIAIPLPREIASGPLVIFRGYELAVETLAVVAILGSVAIPLATAIFPSASTG